MLTLSGMPLQTAGERAFFAELARWDTGSAVRGAVVASLPLAGDGALQRRLADAVLIVPDGITVIRIAEVVRQTGVVTAAPEGPWTIGPGAGPGEVLQLAGGGSTPLDGLMRAGMEAAVRLRQAGLEPGRIARLTVLVGDLAGLHPADGDLGDGDQVALLDSRSLLLGLSRAARYTGVDNLRVWTTADVRAALEALGLQGRGPTVEELNGEGFAYSPYVLRRPELMAPAGVTAAATAPPAAAQAAAPAPAGWGTPGAAVMAPAAPMAPVASLAQAPPLRESADPRPAAQAPHPYARASGVDTFAAPVASAPEVAESDDTDGLGGLFGPAEPEHPEDDGGWGFPATAAIPAGPAVAQEWPAQQEQRSGGRRLLLVVAALAVLLLTVVGGAVVASAVRGSRTAAAAPPPAPVAAPTLAPGRTQDVDGVTFRLEATASDATCVGHAYGQVAGFFGSTDCSGLSRALYSARLDGHPAVVAISRVRMSSPAAARALRTLIDRNGTGNVNDLLREGVHYAGGPAALSKPEYASDLNGSDVTIVETAWLTPGSAGTTVRLDAAANSGLVLDLPSLPH